MKLTKEQCEEYVRKHGARCPFCDSNNLMPRSTSEHLDIIRRGVDCVGCGRKWTNRYTLTGISQPDIEPTKGKN